MKIASLRGDSKPAETVLREFPIPSADGKGSRRLLEPVKGSGTGTTDTGPRIVIGIRVDQLSGGTGGRDEARKGNDLASLGDRPPESATRITRVRPNP
jgi:hypothetical protein